MHSHTATSRGLNAEEVAIVRRALLIGLQSFGEIERLQDAATLYKACEESIPDEKTRTLLRKIAEEMRPIHPTGAADTIGEFADALFAMEHAEVSRED